MNRVDLEAASDGLLSIVLKAGELEFARAELSGDDFFLWRQFQRGDDGSLRVDEFRRESGAVFFVIPLRFKTDFHMRFTPAEAGWK